MVRVNCRRVSLSTLSATVTPNTWVRSVVWLGVNAGMEAVLLVMVTYSDERVVRVAVAMVEAWSPVFLMLMSNEADSEYSSCPLLPSLTVTCVKVSEGSLMTWMVPT